MKKKLLMVALTSLLALTACSDEQSSDDTPVNDIQSSSTAKPSTAPAVKPTSPAASSEDLDTDIEGEINKDEIEQDDDFKEDPSTYQTEDEAEFDEPIMEEDAPSDDDTKVDSQPEAKPAPKTNQTEPKTQK